MNPNSKRLVWVDAVKLFAIFLVIWGHCIQQLAEDFESDAVYLSICSFHMPLFMMLSGFFASKLLTRSFKEICCSKFLQLLLPATVFGAIWWFQAHFVPHLKVHGFVHTIYYAYWFLKSLFVCIILFYWGVKVFKRKWIGLSLMVLVSQLMYFVPHLRFLNLKYMFPCFVLGYVLWVLWPYFQRHATVITAVCLAVFVLLLPGYDTSVQYSESYGGGCLQMCYKLLIGFAGSLGVTGLAVVLCNKLDGRKWLSGLANWGRYTLAIYILQSFLCESWLKEFLPSQHGLWFDLVYAPAISVIILALCLLICKLFKALEIYWLFDFNPLRK